jgi:hypothetical protein
MKIRRMGWRLSVRERVTIVLTPEEAKALKDYLYSDEIYNEPVSHDAFIRRLRLALHKETSA